MTATTATVTTGTSIYPVTRDKRIETVANDMLFTHDEGCYNAPLTVRTLRREIAVGEMRGTSGRYLGTDTGAEYLRQAQMYRLMLRDVLARAEAVIDRQDSAALAA